MDVEDAAERIAAHLAAQPRTGFFGAACAGGGGAAARPLAEALGHTCVPEGAPVFRQGGPGDVMYVVLSGYCSLTRGPAAAAAAGAAGAACGAAGAPAPSRRATHELQQHLMIEGLAGGAPRRETRGELAAAAAAAAGGGGGAVGDAPAAPPGAAPAAAAAMPLPLPALDLLPGSSRRGTGDGPPSARIAWLTEGDTFGEAALLDPARRRGYTVMAGDGGTHLATLSGAAWARMAAAGAAQGGGEAAAGGGGAAAQAVLGAACRRLLAAPPGQRAADDVETLALLFGGLEALRRLPADVRLRLARACGAVAVPAGAPVWRQGDAGDSMCVVLSGACAERALPPDEPAEAAPAPTVSSSGAAAAPAGAAGAAAGAPPAAAAAAAPPPLRVCGGRRGATWEEAAFTDGERRRLELDEAAAPSRGAVAGGADDGSGGRDSLYWTARYVRDACAAAAASAADRAADGCGGLPPLAAAAAARWREAVRGRQAAARAGARAAEEEEAGARVMQGMEQLLGKGAALAWAAARRSAAAAPPPAPAGARQPAGPAGAGEAAAAPGPAAAAAAVDGAPAAADGEGGGGPADADAAAAAGSRAAAAAAAATVGAALGGEVLGGASRKGIGGSHGGGAVAPGDKRPARESCAGAAGPQRLRGSCDAASDARSELGGGTAGASQWNESYDGGCASDGASLLGSLDFEASLPLFGGAGDSGAPPPPGGWAAGGGGWEADGGAAAAEELPSRFGEVVRVAGPGQGLGEPALLQRRYARASTVLALGHSLQPAASAAGGEGGGGEEDGRGAPGLCVPAAAPGRVELLRIPRAAFDAAVRASQLAALEGLLAFLASVGPLSGLARDQLMALAVLCHPAAAAPGEALAAQGGRVAGLVVLVEGAARLLDGPTPAAAAAAAAAAAGVAGGGRAAHRRRATADQLSQPARALIRKASLPAARRASGAGAEGAAGAGGGGDGAVLAELGPGAVLGENVLGEDPEQDPYDQQPGAPAFAPLHAATAIAARPCRLLLLSAADLRRFGRALRAPLAAAARARRESIDVRRQLLGGTRAGLEAAAAGLRRQAFAQAGGQQAAAGGLSALAPRPPPPGAPGALTAWDVRGMRRLVPPRQDASLVELAAAGRPFPQALLSAAEGQEGQRGGPAELQGAPAAIGAASGLGLAHAPGSLSGGAAAAVGAAGRQWAEAGLGGQLLLQGARARVPPPGAAAGWARGPQAAQKAAAGRRQAPLGGGAPRKATLGGGWSVAPYAAKRLADVGGGI
ncbi:MAG: hypothetical protein J3K34DRAFT_497757 [Monoraphidium minutum]|nr:MAG: hypothetical protein J3K34DRAFT_497757 [Monoraphidium minutum]